MQTKTFLFVPLAVAIGLVACVPPSVAQVDAAEVKKRKRVIHRCLLDIYIKQAKTPQAIQEYQASLALDPADAPLLFAYGNYLNRNGNAAGAIAQLTKAVNADPGNADYAGSLGLAYLRAKNFPKALEYLQRANSLPGGKEKYQKHYEDVYKYLQELKQRQQIQKKQEDYNKQIQVQKQKQKQADDDDDW